MIVDDEPLERGLLATALSNEGYDVVPVESGEDCLSRVENQKPDLIIMDFAMPGMDGLEATRHLKRNSATAVIPVVMLTGKGTRDAAIAAVRAGAVDVMAKATVPFDECLRRITTVPL